MQVNIPDIGDRLTLASEWAFDLMYEHRNESLERWWLKRQTGRDLKLSFVRKQPHEPWTHPWRWVALQADTLTTWNGYWSDNSADYEGPEALFRQLANDPMVGIRTEGELASKLWLRCRLPAGSQLTVDRVYIRKGMNDFSSISFWALPHGEKKRHRFWVKLKDANTINYLHQES